jgi:membrane protein implicated in regulation of membrane protease activity
MQITARSLDTEGDDPFSPGDEVVVVRMDGRVAEVVKPE